MFHVLWNAHSDALVVRCQDNKIYNASHTETTRLSSL